MGSAACFLDDEGLLLLVLEAGFDDLEAGARWGGGGGDERSGETPACWARTLRFCPADSSEGSSSSSSATLSTSSPKSSPDSSSYPSVSLRHGTREVEQTFFAAFFLGAALALGLGSAFAFG